MSKLIILYKNLNSKSGTTLLANEISMHVVRSKQAEFGIPPVLIKVQHFHFYFSFYRWNGTPPLLSLQKEIDWVVKKQVTEIQ